jgi:hypothetical protein
MNSVPALERGQASGMRATTLNAGTVLSIGVFFSLMIAGVAATLPQSMEASLLAQNVPAEVARQVASAPPVASLFAAFLGYNPMGELISAPVLQALPQASSVVITGKQFFPLLLSGPFMHGLQLAFTFSLILNLIAAVASWLGGGKFVHAGDHPARRVPTQHRPAAGMLETDALGGED